ncbi:MAG: oligosaccharide flippase family protein, partial [Candidatus Aminicenantes bacterium]|nr:oligosaccharide flippase family protein [Candidatus Aminicenantes bacterium]
MNQLCKKREYLRTAIDIRSSGFRRYFANTSWLISEKIFTMLISFFVGVYVARYLGPERLGLLSYSQSFVMILAPLAMMGLDAIVVRELVKDNSRRDVLLGTSFGIRIAGTIAIWFILIAVVPFTNNDAFTNLLIALFASSLLFRSFRVIDFYFQANVLSKYSVFARLLAGILIPVVKIGLVLTEANLIWFVLAFLLQGLMDLV